MPVFLAKSVLKPSRSTIQTILLGVLVFLQFLSNLNTEYLLQNIQTELKSLIEIIRNPGF